MAKNIHMFVCLFFPKVGERRGRDKASNKNRGLMGKTMGALTMGVGGAGQGRAMVKTGEKTVTEKQ